MTRSIEVHIVDLYSIFSSECAHLNDSIDRSSLLSIIIRNESDDVKDLIKNLTLKDAILNLLNAWEKVSMETIVKCWKPVLEFDEPDEDGIPLSTLTERYHPRDINSVVQQTLGMLNMIAPM
ncbi:hypothetical protein QE152_g24682 [Popillia japonica]|uniref:DDE-1 domain-containing protein n=1 Tax=Popillia japonica TaxID=7064 RepID=A0AAW1K5C4_POPJA